MEKISKGHEHEEDRFYSPEKACEEDEINEEIVHFPECNYDEFKDKLQHMRLRIQKNDSADKVAIISHIYCCSCKCSLYHILHLKLN